MTTTQVTRNPGSRGPGQVGVRQVGVTFLESSGRFLQRPLDSPLRTGYTLNFYFVLRLETICFGEQPTVDGYYADYHYAEKNSWSLCGYFGVIMRIKNPHNDLFLIFMGFMIPYTFAYF